MKITAVLFDLDGTLLPMEGKAFGKLYFGTLTQTLAARGYDPKQLLDAILQGVDVMTNNASEKTNEQVFWDRFCEIFGNDARKDEPYFEEYYHTNFIQTKQACGQDPEAAKTVAWLKERGLRVALATNPIFPAVATKQRIEWAGLSPDDFEFYTTYENSCRCKPNPDYYLEILNKLQVTPQECLMVGNDVEEDMVAEKIGMKVFLLTDWLINRSGTDVSRYPNGGFSELKQFLETLVRV